VSSDEEPLFREEALEFVARQRGPGELVRVSTRWTNWAYWGLLALVAAGLVASLVIRVDGEPVLHVLVPALDTLIGRVHG
jgi:hypothetical protein